MKTIQNIVIFLLIAIIVWLFFFRKPDTVYIPDTQYITDTIWIDKPYPVPVPYEVQLPPKTVEIYLKDQKAIDSLKVILSEKDIILQGLYSYISISQDYLKQFPKNPKLIELNLSADSLSLSTLSITGITQSATFPISLQAFKYKWTIEGLGRFPVKPPPAPKTPIGLFAGGGFNFLYTSPTLDFTAEKDWARIRAYGDIRLGLLKKEASSFNLGLKYKFR